MLAKGRAERLSLSMSSSKTGNSATLANRGAADQWNRLGHLSDVG